MDIATWIVSGLLAAAYIAAGIMKATQPKAALVTKLPWAEDFSPDAIRAIGIVELLGGIGLILPWLTGIAPVLTPVAAAGLVVVQAIAARVHVRRKEPAALPINAVLLLVALFVAVSRFSAL